MKKIIAVNASPRTGWNTAKLVKAACEGAASTGAEVEYFDLYRLEPFMGCVSCFGCKLPATEGRCVKKDGLTEVLDKISDADGLIIGSPNYFGDLSSGFRAFFERLVFRSHTYNRERPSCNDHLIPVRLIMTSNCPEEMYERTGYDRMLDNYKRILSELVGPTEVFTCGNTVQVPDYSKYNWNVFDPEDKIKYRDEHFAEYEAKAFEIGAEVCR